MLFIYQQLQEFPDSQNSYLPTKLSFNVGLNILIIFKNEKKSILLLDTHSYTYSPNYNS